MINRRRVMQSLLNLAAVGVASRRETLFADVSVSRTSAAIETSFTLEELLRGVIAHCCLVSCPLSETRLFFEIALARVQRSTEGSPAFWQACADSAARLEIIFSGYEPAHSARNNTTQTMLYQLRRLRDSLAKQTVRAIGERSLPG